MSSIYAGALTNKPYAFKNRPWELNNVSTVDVFDSLGSTIYAYIYGAEIKRILPLKNDNVNEDWISNRTRYFFEGLYKWRINIPLLRKERNRLVYSSWIQSFCFFILKLWMYCITLKNFAINFVLNNSADYDLVVTTKLLSTVMGYSIFKSNTMRYINDFYLFYINPNFFNDIKNKRIFLFLGMNLRLESPILNIKLRKNMFESTIIYSNLGCVFNDNLNSLSLGLNIKNLLMLLKGKLKFNMSIIKLLKKIYNTFKIFSEYLMFLLGNNFLYQNDNICVYKYLHQKKKNLKVVNLTACKEYSKFLSFDFFSCYKNLFFVKNLSLDLNVHFLNLFSILYEDVILKKVNEISNNRSNLDIVYIINGHYSLHKRKKFVIFQGHHSDIRLFDVDIVFPNITFLEKVGKFLNLEGNILKTNRVITTPFYARNDWVILNALYLYIITFIDKIYNFNVKIDEFNYLNSNRFYADINLNNKWYNRGFKYTISYFFEESSKCYLNNNSIFFNYIKMPNFSTIKIYSKIIINYYFNLYEVNILDKYSPSLRQAGNCLKVNLPNFSNI